MSKFLRPEYQALRAYTPGEQPKTNDLIKLNTNENPYPPSPRVNQILSAWNADHLRLYSNIPATNLVAALAEKYALSPRQILVGNGSDEILYMAILAFGSGGVAYPDITYGFYRVWANLFLYPSHVVPLRPDFTVNPADYLANREMVLLANPNAPTGVMLPVREIERIVCANPDQIVLVDEAYVEFGGESAVPLLGRYDNLLVVNTFSKSYSLAGARLGFAMGAPDLIEDLNKIKFSLNPYNVNTLSQLVGEAAVRDEAYYRDCRARVAAAREWTMAQLKALDFTVLDSRANFLFARPPRLGGREYLEALRARAILVRHFDEARIRDFVRITIGTPRQMEALLAATREILGAKS